MGNLPSSTSTEPLAQGKHRNLSTISLPPTIPRRHHPIKDSERKEIFPISDEGAPPCPPLAGRRGSIGFFRGKRARAPMALDHTQLFKNLQNLQELQNMNMEHCSWQTCHYLSDCSMATANTTATTTTPGTTTMSNPNSNLNSLSTTPTTAATTPALTAVATPTTPVGPHHFHSPNNSQCHSHLHSHPYHHHQHYQQRSPQPTSPVAASILDYHPRQEQKLATFMKRNLVPPHALLTVSLAKSHNKDNNNSSEVLSPTAVDCCTNGISPVPVPNAPGHYRQHDHHHPLQRRHVQPSNSCPCERRPALEPQSSVDSIPSTHDVPCISVSEWGNQGRWAGEQEWSDDIPEGLEHDGGPWDVMDSYTVEQHITRALFKGQNYSAPLDFSKRAHDGDQQRLSEQGDGEFEDSEEDDEDREEGKKQEAMTSVSYEQDNASRGSHPIVIPRSIRDSTSSPSDSCHNAAAEAEAEAATAAHMSSAYSSMATLSPLASTLHKEDERSLVILSVGCGNSQWATEMALAHPQSAIHAINVSQIPSLPTVPETTPSFDLDNLFFYNLDDNSLRVPFKSNSVDYIHVRRFLPNVNKTKYFAFLKELFRVLKRGGYLELVELDMRLRDSGVDSCWPSYWTLIGMDKLGIDTSLALNLGGILRTLMGSSPSSSGSSGLQELEQLEVVHKSSVNMPVGIHGGRLGLAAELLCWKYAGIVRPWLMRQAMLSGSEFDDLVERARQETRTLKSYQVIHVAVGRKLADGSHRGLGLGEGASGRLDRLGGSSSAPVSSSMAF
ncbi:hypothetical protein EDD11_006150 [Mortierella claussenii]|nr:hypothetical protein EDD11_006150 [Mortierella claussenii]